jgi:chorismate synthase
VTLLRWRTAGESHGKALVAIIEGVPAGLALDMDRVDADLARRQRGYGRGGRMKIETDRAELLSGTRAGLTLGSPIALLVPNKDHVIEKLPIPEDPRPGHADLAGCQKYGHRDPRAVLERASARETAARVAVAGVARQVLEALDIEVFAHTTALGGVLADSGAFEAAGAERRALRDRSDFLSLDLAADAAMKAVVDAAKEAGDTLGGCFEVRALGLPPGLGSYQSGPERLTARLGAALFSIPAIKGVEFGLGFEVARRPGSLVHDSVIAAPPGQPWGRFARATNRAGGLEGGMSTGEALVVRAAMKPIPTLRQGVPTLRFADLEPVQATWQRSDVTSVPAAGVVGEAMVALELTSVLLEQFGGDSMDALHEALEAHRRRLREV